jgi:hypothetical protein
MSLPWSAPRRGKTAAEALAGRVALGRAGAVALLAAATTMVAVGAHATRPVRRAAPPAAPHGVVRLPEEARGPIAAALGRVEPAYRVRDMRAQNPAAHLAAAFTSTGVTIDSGAAHLSLSPLAYGRGTALLALAPVSPRASANRVTYSRRQLSEWYANGPLGLEQGFTIPRAPRGDSGPLTLAMRLGGNVTARLAGGAITLSGRGVDLRYAGLVANDADGHVLRSWLELKGRRVYIRIDDRGARYPLHVDPFIQQAELTAGDGAANDEFGSGVAVDGDTAVVGARDHKVGANAGQGVLYLFQMPAGGWSEVTAPTAELTASDGEAGDGLGGYSVALSGDTVVAGATSHKVGANAAQGAAYVFVKPPAGWTSEHQSAELISSDGGAGDILGDNVSVSGDTVVAGAGHHKVGSNAEQGAAYVYVMPPGGWASAPNPMPQTSELTSSDGAAGDEFADDVAVSGNTVVAGAGSHKVGTSASQGAAYVFVEPPSGWPANDTQTAELTASDGAAGDELGYGWQAVAIYGNTVVAGAASRKVGGAAYVFVEPAGGWPANDTQTAELVASDGGGGLGYAVAVWGNTVVAGALNHQVGANAGQGAAYVFVMPPGGWASAPGPLTQTSELTASDGAASDAFGISVGVSGDAVIAGAPSHQVGANAKQGAAYVLTRPGPSVAIASPANGATYTQGQVMDASFTCADQVDGSGLASCVGTSPTGAPLETATLGAHTFTVTAMDNAGERSTQSVTYSVVAAARASSAAPIVANARESHRRWREGKKLARISKTRMKPPVGTMFSFSLNQAASVTFTFTQRLAGRKAGPRCVAKTHANAKHKFCKRTLTAGVLSFSGHQGTNKVIFQGRITRTRKLKPGRYALVITAANAAGQKSSPDELGFIIVK